MAAELKCDVVTLRRYRKNGTLTGAAVVKPPGSRMLLYDRDEVLRQLQERRRVSRDMAKIRALEVERMHRLFEGTV